LSRFSGTFKVNRSWLLTLLSVNLATGLICRPITRNFVTGSVTRNQITLPSRKCMKLFPQWWPGA